MASANVEKTEAEKNIENGSQNLNTIVRFFKKYKTIEMESLFEQLERGNIEVHDLSDSQLNYYIDDLSQMIKQIEVDFEKREKEPEWKKTISNFINKHTTFMPSIFFETMKRYYNISKKELETLKI